jgi:hypothetical protein
VTRRRATLPLVALLACAVPPGPERPADAAPRPSFLKGQLHLHSNNSGDSETPPGDVVRWYAEHGYDFIVFTDHNRITEQARPGDMLVVPGMEITINVERCEPPPEGPLCPLHVNALFVDPTRSTVEPADPADLRRTTLFAWGIAKARSLGALAQINHPNFHWAADADTIAAVADGPLLLEVANEAIDSVNGGDATHPSTFAIWDQLLARGVHVWGTATDDAHHYGDAERVRARGELAFEGDRGWVMVRAPRDANAEQLRAAVSRGDFYASNGAVLDDIECDAGALSVWAQAPGAAVRCFAGGEPFPAEPAESTRRVCALASTPGAYVRAEIVDADGRRAWTQPCWSP